MPQDTMVGARHLGFKVLTRILWSNVANLDADPGRDAFILHPFCDLGFARLDHGSCIETAVLSAYDDGLMVAVEVVTAGNAITRADYASM